jgi:hypothetical protein
LATIIPQPENEAAIRLERFLSKARKTKTDKEMQQCIAVKIFGKTFRRNLEILATIQSGAKS